MGVVRSRAEVANAAFLLFTATLIILVEVRVPTFDIIADVVGGVLVVVAALRINGAITGAGGLDAVLVVLASRSSRSCRRCGAPLRSPPPSG